MCSTDKQDIIKLEKQIERYEYSIKLWQKYEARQISKACTQRLTFSDNVLIALAGCPMEFITGRYNNIMKLYDKERGIV